MGLEELEAQVMAEARNEASGLVEAAREEAARLLARFESEAGSELRNAAEEAERLAAGRTRSELARARQAGRLELLRAQNEVLDEVFRRVREAVMQLPLDRYVDVVRGWLAALPEDAGGTLRVSPAEVDLFSSRLETLNAGRPEAGRFRMVVADPGVARGVVVEGAGFSIDLSLDHRVAALRQALAGEVAKRVFAS